MIRKIIVGLLAFAIILVPGAAVAHNGVDHSSDREARQHETSEMRNPQDEARKKLCEERAATISAIMTRGVERAENYGTLLSTITERLQAFAGDLGERSMQYNFTQVDKAQAAFESNLVALKAVAELNCNATSPKTQIAAFREANQAVMKDLKDWRAALKAVTTQLRESEAQ